MDFSGKAMKMRLLSIGVVAMALVTPMQISHAEDAVEKKKPEFADMTVEQVQAAIKEGKVTIIDVNGKKRYDAGMCRERSISLRL